MTVVEFVQCQPTLGHVSRALIPVSRNRNCRLQAVWLSEERALVIPDAGTTTPVERPFRGDLPRSDRETNSSPESEAPPPVRPGMISPEP
jgi:hypothetical protein